MAGKPTLNLDDFDRADRDDAISSVVNELSLYSTDFIQCLAQRLSDHDGSVKPFLLCRQQHRLRIAGQEI